MTVDQILRQGASDLHADVRATTDAPAALERVEAHPARQQRRLWLPTAAAVVVLLGLAGAAIAVATARDDGQPVASGGATSTSPAIVGGPDPGESVGLDVTASPSTDLAAGDTVAVTADGLPSSDVDVALCLADAFADGAADAERCDIGLAGDLRIDPDGHLAGSFVVDREVTVADGTSFDCGAEGVRCAVGIVLAVPGEEPGQPGEPRATRSELIGLVGVAFTTAAPDPVPTLTVAPDDGLHHGQTVTVEGVDFIGGVGHAQLCAGSARSAPCTSIPLARSTGAELPTDDDGRFRVEIPVWRAFPVNPLVGEEQVADCAERGCTLTVTDDVGRTSVPVDLAFADDEPVPEAPTLEVAPTTGLRPGDAMTVTVRGLGPGEEALVAGCSTRPDAPGLPCAQFTTIGTVVGRDAGPVEITVEVVDPARDGVDCTRPGVCGIGLTPPTEGAGDPLLNATKLIPVQYAPP